MFFISVFFVLISIYLRGGKDCDKMLHGYLKDRGLEKDFELWLEKELRGERK